VSPLEALRKQQTSPGGIKVRALMIAIIAGKEAGERIWIIF
jgi:hypothetical protein